MARKAGSKARRLSRQSSPSSTTDRLRGASSRRQAKIPGARTGTPTSLPSAGRPPSGAERRALTHLRATYAADPARGSSAAAAERAIDPEEEEAQRWEDEGGAIGASKPATDPPVEA